MGQGHEIRLGRIEGGDLFSVLYHRTNHVCFELSVLCSALAFVFLLLPSRNVEFCVLLVLFPSAFF